MKRLVAFLLFIFFLLPSITSANARMLDIGLFWKNEPRSVLIMHSVGEYDVYGDGHKIVELNSKTVLKIQVADTKVVVKTLAETLGNYDLVELKKKEWENVFKIKATDPNLPDKEFHGDLKIKPLKGKLRIINHVFIEHYVAGVVESEAGSKEPMEYYKVQAVICRTYALNNIRRHAGEGFQLCDKVHCQVYHRMSKLNPDIQEGVKQTIGIVVVDSDINLITAAFSSNCGGQTSNSEDVWSKAVPYLRSREDHNCLEMPHANWEAVLTPEEWKDYLKRRFNYPVNDSVQLQKAMDFCPEGRHHILNPEVPGTQLKTIRRDFKLSSAYFVIDTEPDTVRIQGRGYGHGVGLCQEGAMHMAHSGISYQDILHFYYKDVHLINLSVIDFFRAE